MGNLTGTVDIAVSIFVEKDGEVAYGAVAVFFVSGGERGGGARKPPLVGTGCLN